MARDHCTTTIKLWHAIQNAHAPSMDIPGPDLHQMINRLVDDNTMLLRAVEEIEARPWWRRRRYNPYAR
jgi:hypothetical protein